MKTFLLSLCLFVALTDLSLAHTRIDADVVYGHRAGMALVYDVYQPDESNGAGIIFVASYGWYSPWSSPQQRLETMHNVLTKGFTVYMVNHGSAPYFTVPQAASDVRAAVRHIRVNAKGQGVDPERLGIWGASAGGHLALLMGLNPEGELDVPAGSGLRHLGPDYVQSTQDAAQVAAVVAWFPPVDLRRMVGASTNYPALNFAPELAPTISPILFVSSDDPATLMVHGDADEVVPLATSKAMSAKMQQIGVGHQVIVIEGGKHSFPDASHMEEAVQASINWFLQHLVPES